MLRWLRIESWQFLRSQITEAAGNMNRILSLEKLCEIDGMDMTVLSMFVTKRAVYFQSVTVLNRYFILLLLLGTSAVQPIKFIQIIHRISWKYMSPLQRVFIDKSSDECRTKAPIPRVISRHTVAN